MDIRIEGISPSNQRHLNQVDGAFTVDKLLDVIATGFGDALQCTSTPPYEKRYPPDHYDVPTYIDAEDKAIFFAFADGNLAGQIILNRHWNRHAWVDDIAVDRSYRRRGVGTALMDRARDWAVQRNFPAIFLETQNNNVAACRFYHAYGFKIGGYDRYLYFGSPYFGNKSRPDEIAVFWYYFLR